MIEEALREHGFVIALGVGLAIVILIVRGLLKRPAAGRSSGDPDPLAEAEVYLSFGRKEQAIGILEEAIKTHPARRQEFEIRIRELRGQPQPGNPVAKQ